MERINEIIKKVEISDLSYMFLLESLYSDIKLLENFSSEGLTKEEILNNIILKIKNDKKKNDAIRKKIFNDVIKFCDDKNISKIKDNFLEELQNKAISSILAYIYALHSKKYEDFYYNIYYNDIKNTDKLLKIIKNNSLAININMYKNFCENYHKILKENDELKEKNEALNYLLENVVIDDIEEFVFEENVKIIKEKKEYTDCILIGLYDSLAKKYEGITFINTKDVTRYKDKIKNAKMILFDTSKNSHKAYYFAKAINKNVVMI